MTTYEITFTNEAGKILGSLQTNAWSDWDACEFGWNNAPEGTADFQVNPKD
ncbi:MAG: hypothetical protein H0T56_09780 [Pseudaminobacter sp.]|nr:hypothetical protein [Pseudaminobacter sp.]